MPTADILRIALTVGTVQLICDIVARRFVFAREPYQRSVSAFARAKTKRDKILSSASAASNATKSESSQAKSAKKIQRAEDDYTEAAAEVARRHTAPSFFTSMVFLILYRILSAEYSGRIVAMLPFRPWGLLRRLTARNLHVVDADRCCAFLFVYVLSTLSVKFVIHRLVGVRPPRGADGGVSTLLDAPKSQRVLKSFGIDTDEFNQVRKSW